MACILCAYLAQQLEERAATIADLERMGLPELQTALEVNRERWQETAAALDEHGILHHS